MTNYTPIILSSIFILIIVFLTWRAIRGKKKKEDPGIRHLKNSLSHVVADGTLAAFEQEQYDTQDKNTNALALSYAAIIQTLVEKNVDPFVLDKYDLHTHIRKNQIAIGERLDRDGCSIHSVKLFTDMPSIAQSLYMWIKAFVKEIAEQQRSGIYLTLSFAGNPNKLPFNRNTFLKDCLKKEGISTSHAVLVDYGHKQPPKGKKVGRWIIHIKHWPREMLVSKLASKDGKMLHFDTTKVYYNSTANKQAIKA